MINDPPWRVIRLKHLARRFFLSLRLHWVAIAVAVLTCAAFWVGSWILIDQFHATGYPFEAASASVLASLAASAIWFCLAYIVTREYLADVIEFESLEHFPWEEHILASRRIEVNVQGWDGLLVGRGGQKSEPLRTKRGQVWRKFFDEGGTLILMLPKLPQGPPYTLDDPLFQQLTTVANRNTKTLEKQVEEIRNTELLANTIAGKDGVVQVRWCSQLRWICTVKFDDRLLLISPYTHREEGQPFVEPAFRINLHGFARARAWVELLHQHDNDKVNG